MFGIAIFVCMLILLFMCRFDSSVKDMIVEVLTERFIIFSYVLFFINCGPSMTQAMYYHCDNALLRYNFYRNKKTMMELFFLRLKSIISITFIPVLVLIVCLLFLYVMFIEFNVFDIVGIILGIIMMTILFSLHHLGMYYLLQPYTNNMKNRSILYVFVLIGVVMLLGEVIELVMPTFILALIISLVTIIYFILIVWLVKKYGSKTFKSK